MMSTVNRTIANLDRNELPRYSVPEAAHYLRMSKATLKSWISGRNDRASKGNKPRAGLIDRPDPKNADLSFSNLIEAHVLLALRTEYGVKRKEVRTALSYARRTLRIDRVLLSPDLRAIRGNVFLEKLNELTNLGKGGQAAMPEILGAYLERIEWNIKGLPVRIFPLTRPEQLDSPKILAIDPEIAFGRPVINRRAITTSVIAERFRAGESSADLADDYDLEVFEVEEALRYELPEAA
jgi:uncharacterized protein (DUF433 family)